jgi:CheY-like chemotaxis protein
VPEALRQCSRRRPGLIICDIGLPGKDGYALIRCIREREGIDGHHTPAIAVSGICACDMTERVRAAGFDEFLPKPVDVATLLAIARWLLEPAWGSPAPE